MILYGALHLRLKQRKTGILTLISHGKLLSYVSLVVLSKLSERACTIISVLLSIAAHKFQIQVRFKLLCEEH